MKFINLSLVILSSTLLSFGSTQDVVSEQPAQQCTKPHEQWLGCGESCNRDACKVPNYFVACESKCSPGCYCECGYYRDFDGSCVLQKDCPSFDNYGYAKICPVPNQTCSRKHEVYTKCGSYCGGTCRDFRIPINYLCIQGCKEACVCEDNFLRHPVTGECVPKHTCPTTEEYDYDNNVPIDECKTSKCKISRSVKSIIEKARSFFTKE